MRVVWALPDDLPAFVRKVTPWLKRHALTHNMVQGLLAGASQGLYDTCWTLAVYDAQDALALVAVRTPPRSLVLSMGEAEACQALADALVARQVDLPGVFAPRLSARAFTEAWRRAHPRLTVTPHKSLVLYRCDVVKPPVGVRGEARVCVPSDAGWFAAWMRAFERDTDTEPTLDVERRAQVLCEAGDVVFRWVDGAPVASAAIVRRQEQTASIGLVYTPPAQRRQGYGAAVTAALSQRVLDAGAASVNLFADAANPTTNHIYQSIGYDALETFEQLQYS